MEIITATDLARKTRDVLDMVTAKRETVLVERNQVTIARIVPAQPTMNITQVLELIQPRLSEQQAKRWLKDSRAGFDESVRDPWA